jgi:hypothetical protein
MLSSRTSRTVPHLCKDDITRFSSLFCVGPRLLVLRSLLFKKRSPIDGFRLGVSATFQGHVGGATDDITE